MKNQSESNTPFHTCKKNINMQNKAWREGKNEKYLRFFTLSHVKNIFPYTANDPFVIMYLPSLDYPQVWYLFSTSLLVNLWWPPSPFLSLDQDFEGSQKMNLIVPSYNVGVSAREDLHLPVDYLHCHPEQILRQKCYFEIVVKDWRSSSLKWKIPKIKLWLTKWKVID